MAYAISSGGRCYLLCIMCYLASQTNRLSMPGKFAAASRDKSSWSQTNNKVNAQQSSSFFSQFHQHFTNRFSVNLLVPKKVHTLIDCTKSGCYISVRKRCMVKCWWSWHLLFLLSNGNFVGSFFYNVNKSIIMRKHLLFVGY